MTTSSKRLTEAVENYFTDLGRMKASGGTTGERSSYGPLANLLNAVAAPSSPRCSACRNWPTRARAGLRNWYFANHGGYQKVPCVCPT